MKSIQEIILPVSFLLLITVTLSNPPDGKTNENTKSSSGIRSYLATDQSDTAAAHRFLGRANMHLEKEEYNKALEYLDAAHSLGCKNLKLQLYYAQAYLGNKNYTKAITVYNKLLKDHPDSASLYTNRATCNFMLKAYEKAVADYDAALKLGDSTWTIFRNRAQAQLELKEYDSALTSLEEIPSSCSQENEIAFLKACLYIEQKMPEQALQVIKEVMERSPESAYVLAYVSDLFRNIGMINEAFNTACKALEIDLNNQLALEVRGYIYRYRCEYKKSIEDYTTVLTSCDIKPHMYRNRAIPYIFLGEYEKALADIERGMALDTSVVTWIGLKCDVYARMGNIKKAIAIVDSLIQAYPERKPKGLYSIACYYSLDNKRKKAIEYLEKALKAGYSSFYHMANDPDLDNIRNVKEYHALVKKYAQ